MKVVTYATHAEGTFNDIVNNKYGIDVVVLGWGTKWQGFMHRLKIYREYLETLFDNDIVVFIDGFDSYILKSIDDLEETFKSLDCKILVSENTFSKSYLGKRVFGTCKNNTTANAGLYMGYVSDLKNFMKEISLQTSPDDQKNLNTVCKKFQNLKIDTESVIFKNINQFQSIENFKQTNAYFGQTPGAFSVNRYVRMIPEYTQFLIPEIILFILIVYFLYLHFVLKK
jgi:hypothetical protein